MKKALAYLSIGEKAVVKSVDGGVVFQRKLESLNIRVGKAIKLIARQPFQGPIVIEVDRRRVILGRGISIRVIVEPSR